jgi:hypothetical protein
LYALIGDGPSPYTLSQLATLTGSSRRTVQYALAAIRRGALPRNRAAHCAHAAIEPDRAIKLVDRVHDLFRDEPDLYSYADVAKRLGVTVDAAKRAVHRLRITCPEYVEQPAWYRGRVFLGYVRSIRASE